MESGTPTYSRSILDNLLVRGDEWIVRSHPEPTMLVPGAVPRGGTAFIVGEPKAGKTWLAFDLAISIANGTAFLGLLPVDLNGRERGRVLLISYEGSEDAARARFRGMLEARGLDPVDGMTGIDVLWRTAPLVTDMAFAGELSRERPPWDLIIVDTLAKAWDGDENSNVEAANLMRLTEQLAARGSTIVYLHHAPKNGDTSGRSLGASIRGASAFHGATDATIRVVRRKGRSLVTFEARDDAPADQIAFDWCVQEPTGLLSLDARFEAGTPDRLDALPGRIVEFLHEAGGATRNAITTSVTGRKEDVAAALDGLIEQGAILLDPIPEEGKPPQRGTTHYLAQSTEEGRSCVPSPMGEERVSLTSEEPRG